MRSVTLAKIGRGALAASAAGVVWLGLAAAPALAGDDGEAPIWVGVGSIFGPIVNFAGGGGHKTDPIVYEEHGKLVLPPTMELEPPAAASAVDPAWPRDPDVERRKREKAEEEKAKAHRFYGPGRQVNPPFGDVKGPVTVSATAGMGPGERRPCSAPGQSCQAQTQTETPTSPSINWNPLTWVGLQKKPQTVLGAEPDRDWLTDPPKGYRQPAEGEDVRVDN